MPSGSPPGGDPHQGLHPLLEATSLTCAKTTVVRMLLLWEDWRLPPRRLELVAKGVKLLEHGVKGLKFAGVHIATALRLRHLRDHDLVLVREFLTPLLPLAWAVMWPLRSRVAFLINHNLQEASIRPVYGRILRTLEACGCRFAILDTAAGFDVVGLNPDRALVIPHPIVGHAPPRQPGPQPVIGVVGEVRAEKGSIELLDLLAQVAERREIELLLGTPEPEEVAAWAGRGFEIVDTGPHDCYRAALARCDVVILNYRRERYFWRASGVAADAVACGTAVICPNYPVMRHQLTVPEPVGTTFEAPADLEAAIDRALALLPTLPAAVAAHADARSPAVIAACLDAYVRSGSRSNGSGGAAE